MDLGKILAGKDQPVLLTFWADWCKPCLNEMPDLQRLHDKYGDRIRFVGLAHGLIKRSFPTTTVVLMTGQGSEDVAIDALRGGARDYLRKPFSLQDLVKRVDALFAVRRKGVERRHPGYPGQAATPDEGGYPGPRYRTRPLHSPCGPLRRATPGRGPPP